MQKGDEVLFYHSGEEKAVVGIAKVARSAYQDPTAKEGDWATVDLAPVKPLRQPVTLREIKGNSRLKGIPLGSPITFVRHAADRIRLLRNPENEYAIAL